MHLLTNKLLYSILLYRVHYVSAQCEGEIGDEKTENIFGGFKTWPSPYSTEFAGKEGLELPDEMPDAVAGGGGCRALGILDAGENRAI